MFEIGVQKQYLNLLNVKSILSVLHIHMRKQYLIILMALTAFTLAKAQPSSLTFPTFANGFDNPVDLTHAGDDRVFVVEQDGAIWIVDQNGTVNPTPFMDIDPQVNSGANERGLLGLAFHPDYANNGYFYVNYNNSSGATVISRFSVYTLNPDLADPNSEFVIMTFSQPYSNHNGGGIKFGPDGYLYIATGDGGSGGDPQNNGQNRTTMLGKMLRIDVNGVAPYAIPADNPFVSDPNTNDEIWNLGLRNPWRFDFDRTTGDLWIGDVGQNAREEIDFQLASSPGGENYGWRCYEANQAYNTSGCQGASSYVDPIYHYANNFSTGCSVTGGTVYRGARYGNLWGTYFFSDYCSNTLWYTTGDPVNGFSFQTWNGFFGSNPSSFGRDVYGQVYIVNHGGTIVRIEDNTCDPKAYIDAADSVTFCSNGGMLMAYSHPGLTYQWNLNGSPISGATNASYMATSAGSYTVEVANGSCTDLSDAVNVSLSGVAVSISGLDTLYTSNDPPVTMVGTPAGGVFSGPCVTGNVFDPQCAPWGAIQIIYTYTDPTGGCTVSDTFNTNVLGVSIDASELLEGFAFYPNPGHQNFKVRFNLEQAGPVGFQVVDALGRKVYDSLEELSSGAQEVSMVLPEVAPGMYYLKLEIDGNSYSERFVVQ